MGRAYQVLSQIWSQKWAPLGKGFAFTKGGPYQGGPIFVTIFERVFESYAPHVTHWGHPLKGVHKFT